MNPTKKPVSGGVHLSHKVFGSRNLEKSTEFHGIEICRGSGNFKGVPLEQRLEVLEQLLSMAAQEFIKRIYVRINPENITHTKTPPDEIAFIFLIEQVEAMLAKEDQLGMIFGDYDAPKIGLSVANLSRFRRGGTSWAEGKDIDHLIDTVHFAKSHHSRLIQLADVFLYARQFYSAKNETPWRKAVEDVAA
jgi:Protein of unknown function (DUF3800)